MFTTVKNDLSTEKHNKTVKTWQLSHFINDFNDRQHVH